MMQVCSNIFPLGPGARGPITGATEKKSMVRTDGADLQAGEEVGQPAGVRADSPGVDGAGRLRP